jgi:DNA-binding CsgD family transcriptional regulator
MVFTSAPSTYYSETPESIAPAASPNDSCSKSLSHFQLLQAAIEGFVDGLMIVTEQGEVIEANIRARQICRRLTPRQLTTTPATNGEAQRLPSLPDEVWRVCQALIESRDMFPGQRIIPEFEIAREESLTLRIRVRWLDLDLKLSGVFRGNPPCILVTLEDRNQAIRNQVTSDIRKYNLTPCEGQVWQLRLQGYSYQAIASKLYITTNTVKKHIKSIRAKRRAVLGDNIE